MLGNGKCVFTDSLPVPPRHAGETMGYILYLDIERRRVEQVKAPPRQHALPGARLAGRSVGACHQALPASASGNPNRTCGGKVSVTGDSPDRTVLPASIASFTQST